MPRPTKVRPPSYSFEIAADRLLCALHHELRKEFDLSLETAKRLGGSNLHGELSRNGDSKTGGMMMAGNVAVHRYINYSLGDKHVQLLAQLEQGETIDNATYIVGACGIPDFKGVYIEFSAFESVIYSHKEFSAAAAHYRALLSTFAPKR